MDVRQVRPLHNVLGLAVLRHLGEIAVRVTRQAAASLELELAADQFLRRSAAVDVFRRLEGLEFLLVVREIRHNAPDLNRLHLLRDVQRFFFFRILQMLVQVEELGHPRGGTEMRGVMEPVIEERLVELLTEISQSRTYFAERAGNFHVLEHAGKAMFLGRECLPKSAFFIQGVFVQNAAQLRAGRGVFRVIGKLPAQIADAGQPVTIRMDGGKRLANGLQRFGERFHFLLGLFRCFRGLGQLGVFIGIRGGSQVRLFLLELELLAGRGLKFLLNVRHGAAAQLLGQLQLQQVVKLLFAGGEAAS